MWEYYERRSPIQVKGGIKSKSKKGDFSATWWGRKWIEALESFNDSARLSRGRSYARKGQVVSIDVENGSIHALVQGSRPDPYEVTIEMDPLSEQSWNLLIDALSKKAIYTARLLAGELPLEIEDIFKELKVLLLPSHHSHLKTDCSCPDWSNPCKHVAAVLYLLGEEFDRDPFLLFKARGMDRETFLKLLEQRSQIDKPMPKEEVGEPLCSDPVIFWQLTEIKSDWLLGAFEKPDKSGILSKSLGKFPFWHGEQNLDEFLEKVYNDTTDYALKLLDSKEL